jgi:hypothetical protein
VRRRAMVRLDSLVAAAGKLGVKLLFPFVNFWTDYTSMQFWVDGFVGLGADKALFYTDPLVRSAGGLGDSGARECHHCRLHIGPFIGCDRV